MDELAQKEKSGSKYRFSRPIEKFVSSPKYITNRRSLWIAPSRNYITASALHHFQAKSQVSQPRPRTQPRLGVLSRATLGGYSATDWATEFLYRDPEANNNNDMAKKLPWRFCLLTYLRHCYMTFTVWTRELELRKHLLLQLTIDQNFKHIT